MLARRSSPKKSVVGAGRTLDDRVHAHYILPGCTIRCVRCSAVQATVDPCEAKKQKSVRLVKGGGSKRRTSATSATEFSIGTACTSQANTEKTNICWACAPDLTKYSCDICHKTDKLALDFPVSERQERIRGHRRCYSCFICCVYGAKHSCESGLSQGERCCVKCRVRTCGVCDEERKHGQFPTFQHNHNACDSHIRCRSCAV